MADGEKKRKKTDNPDTGAAVDATLIVELYVPDEPVPEEAAAFVGLGMKDTYTNNNNLVWTRQSFGWRCESNNYDSSTREYVRIPAHMYLDSCKCSRCTFLRKQWRDETFNAELASAPRLTEHFAMPSITVPELSSYDSVIVDQGDLSRMHRNSIVVAKERELESDRLTLFRHPVAYVQSRMQAATAQFEPTNPAHLELMVNYLILRPIGEGERLLTDLKRKSDDLDDVMTKARELYFKIRERIETEVDIPTSLMIMYEATAREARNVYGQADALRVANESQRQLLKKAMAPIYELRDDLKQYCEAAKDMQQLRDLAKKVASIRVSSERNAQMVVVLASYCMEAVGMMGEVRKALEAVDQATNEVKAISQSTLQLGA